MRGVSNPLDIIASSVYSAIHTDLSDNSYGRRPLVDEVNLVVYSNTWGHGSMGFGGLGTASFVKSLVVVVSDTSRSEYCIYFGGRYAYKVTRESAGHLRFLEELKSQSVADCRDAADVYGTPVNHGVGLKSP